MQYEPVIGLEVHVQLNTNSKIFCSCSTKFGAGANSQTCPVCLGLPGVLPVLNEEALKKAILAGIALNCSISKYSKFDRKNYFYPDLPKAYQISQFDRPICYNGFIDITTENYNKKIGVTRLHLEEDAGKLIHSDVSNSNKSYVDYNRTGMPLAEIVSEPDMRSSEEAYAYLQNLKSIMKYLEVSDCNMEEGSLRCDVNISLRESSDHKFGEKVEIKNLNSFKAVKAAIDFEIKRQGRLLNNGEKIIQETRLWDADKNETLSMRSKEEAHDYRYFPDPDLPPIRIEESYINEIKASLPELPAQKKERFINEYCLPDYDAGILTTTKQLAGFFESAVKSGANAKKASNWILSELLAHVEDTEKMDSCPVKPSQLAKLIQLIDDNTISGKIAKTVFSTMLETGNDPDAIVEEKQLKQVTDLSSIEKLVDEVIRNNQQSVDDYKSGKEKALKFLVGQIMKESRGKANPQIVNELLVKKLS